MARRIVDIHTHVFPDALAARAIGQLAARSGVEPRLDGTARGLEESMRRNGVALSLTLPVSTKASQVASINAFAIELGEMPGLANFGSLFPGYEGNAVEIARLKAAGIKGVKFHPDYQEFFVDEGRMLPLYRLMAEAGLVALFHAGEDIEMPPPVHCTPERLARVLDSVPELTVVAAHFGGFRRWDEVERHLIGRELWLDTSYTLAFLPAERFARMARAHGIGRILFGTDSPWADQGAEIGLLERSGLTDAELDAVFGGNASRLLGIP